MEEEKPQFLLEEETKPPEETINLSMEKDEDRKRSAPIEELEQEETFPMLKEVKEEPINYEEEYDPYAYDTNLHGQSSSSSGYPYEHSPTHPHVNDIKNPKINTKLTWHQARAESDDVRYKTTQDYFTKQESLSVFTFLLDEVRSQNPARLGRVAKRRVDLSDANVWTRYKSQYGGRRELSAYRGHFRIMSYKLQQCRGLSELEKLDLYYALDIRLPKTTQAELINKYGVEINSKGVIVGCPRMTHWDLVHEDSDKEGMDIIPKRGKNKWMRFSEREDGLMWQYLLDHVNNGGPAEEVITKNFWLIFKVTHEGADGDDAPWRRVPETYRSRYFKFLAPNLHLMPFDIETKAALYQSLGISVAAEFREELTKTIDVKLDGDGKVVEYADRPEKLVLQSRPFESIIGITSGSRVSILRNPHLEEKDSVPYTRMEEAQIWSFIRSKIVNKKGRTIRIRQKLTGWNLWKDFRTVTRTERSVKSLATHFTENMTKKIMSTDFTFLQKLELLFALDVPVEDEDLKVIHQNTDVYILNRKGALRYISGNGFMIGKNRQKSGHNPKNREYTTRGPYDTMDDDSDDSDSDDDEKVKKVEKKEKVTSEKDIQNLKLLMERVTKEHEAEQKQKKAQKKKEKPKPKEPEPMVEEAEVTHLQDGRVSVPYFSGAGRKELKRQLAAQEKREKKLEESRLAYEKRMAETNAEPPENHKPEYIPIGQRVAYNKINPYARKYAAQTATKRRAEPLQAEQMGHPYNLLCSPEQPEMPMESPIRSAPIGRPHGIKMPVKVLVRRIVKPSQVTGAGARAPEQQPIEAKPENIQLGGLLVDEIKQEVTDYPFPIPIDDIKEELTEPSSAPTAIRNGAAANKTPIPAPYTIRKSLPQDPREAIPFEEFLRRIESKKGAAPPQQDAQFDPMQVTKTAAQMQDSLPAVCRQYYIKEANKQKVVNNMFNSIEDDLKKFLLEMKKIKAKDPKLHLERAKHRCELMSRQLRVMSRADFGPKVCISNTDGSITYDQ